MPDVNSPDQLAPQLLRCINAGDIDGIVACYDRDAVVERPDGTTVRGLDEIRALFLDLLATNPRLEPGPPHPALIHGDIALTTGSVGSTVTAEVARRGADGVWRWIIDRPDVTLFGRR